MRHFFKCCMCGKYFTCSLWCRSIVEEGNKCYCNKDSYWIRIGNFKKKKKCKVREATLKDIIIYNLLK